MRSMSVSATTVNPADAAPTRRGARAGCAVDSPPPAYTTLPPPAAPAGAQRGLRDRLLARGIQHATAAGQPGERLDQQRRLADARIAAEQHQAAGDHAAAEHAIELGDAGGAAVARTDLDGLGDRDRRATIGDPARARPRRRRLDLLDQARPLLAQRTASQPLGLAVAARLAAPDRPARLRGQCARLGHASSYQPGLTRPVSSSVSSGARGRVPA